MSNEPRQKKVKVLLFWFVTFHIYQLLTKRQYLQLEDKVCPEADYWFVLFKVCILRLIFQVFENKGFFFLIFFFYFLSSIKSLVPNSLLLISAGNEFALGWKYCRKTVII